MRQLLAGSKLRSNRPDRGDRRMRLRFECIALALTMSFVVSTGPVASQTPAGAFNSAISTACANPTPGSELASRCQQIFGGGPGAAARALATAAGNRLNVVPAQGRIAALGGRTRARGLRVRNRDARQDDYAFTSDAIGATGITLRGDENQAEVAAHADFDAWTLQASAGMGRLERDASDAEAGFDNDRLNALVGISRRVSDKALLGLALTYEREDTDFVNAAGEQDQRAMSFIAHGAWWPRDGWALYGSAGFGNVDLDTRREIDFNLAFPGVPGNSDVRFRGTALGATDGDRVSAAIGVERAIFTGEHNLRLDAGVDYERTDFDALQETGGGGFAVRLPARSIRSTQSKLGFSGDFVTSTASGVVTPYARAYWRHEFDNDGRLVTIRLRDDARGTGIAFLTPDPDRNFFEVGAGVAWLFSGGRSLYFDVESLFGHEFLSGYTVSFGGSLEF